MEGKNLSPYPPLPTTKFSLLCHQPVPAMESVDPYEAGRPSTDYG